MMEYTHDNIVVNSAEDMAKLLKKAMTGEVMAVVDSSFHRVNFARYFVKRELVIRLLEFLGDEVVDDKSVIQLKRDVSFEIYSKYSKIDNTGVSTTLRFPIVVESFVNGLGFKTVYIYEK
jgi:hypothetical protein